MRLNDDCWPDDSTWQAFNDSVSGRLIQSVPSAAVCHQERYDAGLCNTARTEWTNSFWRTNQTGAYSAILWELGNDQCFIDSPPNAPCDPGLGGSLLPFERIRLLKLVQSLTILSLFKALKIFKRPSGLPTRKICTLSSKTLVTASR